MLRSMTGFGAAAGEAAGRALRIEVRAVNHRHLQVKMRLAPEVAGLEGEIDALVRKRLHRGMVNLTVQVERESRGIEQSIDVEAAERYRGILADLSLRFGGGGAIPVETVLALPGVISAPAEAEIDDPKPVLKLVGAALDELEAMRADEGAAIEADLRRNAAAIAKLVARVEKRMPGVVRAHHELLTKRVAELVGDAAAVDPKDLAREIALLADKLDVSEEIERLKCHLDQLEKFVTKGGDAGRKLDFLVQEIFREANTIGSKCSDAQVAHVVVDVKTHIERLREQVQNVE
jgi:uncharacterized protein (TIGR00255 family)